MQRLLTSFFSSPSLGHRGIVARPRRQRLGEHAPSPADRSVRLAASLLLLRIDLGGLDPVTGGVLLADGEASNAHVLGAAMQCGAGQPSLLAGNRRTSEATGWTYIWLMTV